MTHEMITAPTGSSLQVLGERASERLGADSRLFFEDQTFTGLQLAERTRRLSRGFRDAGLKPGERVVVNGLQRVRPGALIAPQMVAMKTTDDAKN
jgi:non-ribosomal peptide synthetase component E (peptide arylation enzyme)